MRCCSWSWCLVFVRDVIFDIWVSQLCSLPLCSHVLLLCLALKKAFALAWVPPAVQQNWQLSHFWPGSCEWSSCTVLSTYASSLTEVLCGEKELWIQIASADLAQIQDVLGITENFCIPCLTGCPWITITEQVVTLSTSCWCLCT